MWETRIITYHHAPQPIFTMTHFSNIDPMVELMFMMTHFSDTNPMVAFSLMVIPLTQLLGVVVSFNTKCYKLMSRTHPLTGL